jgi:Leucine-rich repeat (LRR) protein
VKTYLPTLTSSIFLATLCAVLVRPSFGGVTDFLLICGEKGACEIKNVVTTVEDNLDMVHQYDKLNMTDLETVKKITFINSTFRSFSSYLLTAMPNLEQIDASDCGVVNADIKVFGPNLTGKVSHLEVLVLAKNGITKLEADTFAAALNLRQLFLQNNSIERLERLAFDGLPQLEVLDLSHNRLVRLEVGLFAPLVSLKQLWLHHNRLEAITMKFFANNRILELLDLEDNVLSSITTDTPTSLQTLKIAGNHLTDLDLTGFELLKAVNLDRNHWNCTGLLQTLAKLREQGVQILESPPVYDRIECTTLHCGNHRSAKQLEDQMQENRHATQSLESKIVQLESNMMIMFRHLMNIQPEKMP